MPATKITDLLPIPVGVRRPHPYQVLGLADGEQDPDVIERAVVEVISRLKGAKTQADPTVWNQAAVLVKEAKKILDNPKRKAELDARFGIVSIDSDVSASEHSPTDALAAFLPPADPLATTPKDPLASVLPPSNPSSTVDETAHTNPVAGVIHGDTPVPSPPPTPGQTSSEIAPTAIPPGLFGTPQTSMESQPSQGVAPMVVKAPRTRRKRSMTGTVVFLMFAFLCFGTIGALLYFLLYGPGQVAITQTDEGISISTQPSANEDAPLVGEPRPLSPPPNPTPRDPIMGNLGRDDPSEVPIGKPSGVDRDVPSLDPSLPTTTPSDSDPSMSDLATTPSTSSEPSDPEPDNSVSTNPETTEPEMSTTEITSPAMVPVTDEERAAADKMLAQVGQLIRAAKWKEMKTAAETALAQPMSEDQREQMEALFEVAELATYYRNGIEKAVADLKTGNDFEIAGDFRVIIVETGEDLLVVRFNAQNRSFTFDEFPWSLAHKLATFAMPDDPTSQAAKAVYQAIAPKATQDYRQEALDWLGEIQGEVDGADPQRLADTLRSLFE